MATGICRIAVRMFRQVRLICLADARVVVPVVRAGQTAHVAAFERIGCPEGGHHAGIVEMSVVAFSGIAGVHDILTAFTACRKLEPILVYGWLGASRHHEHRCLGGPESL